MTNKLNCPACHSTDVKPIVEGEDKMICKKCLHPFMPAEGEQTAQVVYTKHHTRISQLVSILERNVREHQNSVAKGTEKKITWAAVGDLAHVIALLDEAVDFVSPVKRSK